MNEEQRELFAALRGTDTEQARNLLESIRPGLLIVQEDDNDSPLHLIVKNHPELIDDFLKKFEETGLSEKLPEDAKKINGFIDAFLLKNRYGRNALMEAKAQKLENYDEIEEKMLKQLNARDLLVHNAAGETILHIAAVRDAALFIKLYKDVGESDSIALHHVDRAGMTPLHIAAIYQDPKDYLEIVKQIGIDKYAQYEKTEDESHGLKRLTALAKAFYKLRSKKLSDGYIKLIAETGIASGNEDADRQAVTTYLFDKLCLLSGDQRIPRRDQKSSVEEEAEEKEKEEEAQFFEATAAEDKKEETEIAAALPSTPKLEPLTNRQEILCFKYKKKLLECFLKRYKGDTEMLKKALTQGNPFNRIFGTPRRKIFGTAKPGETQSIDQIQKTYDKLQAARMKKTDEGSTAVKDPTLYRL